MKRYIVRNCPAIKEITTLLTSEPPQFQKEWHCCTTGSNLKNCKNITDCVMKRIVELCDTNVSKVLYEGETLKFVEGNPLAKKILELLEIEEVDE